MHFALLAGPSVTHDSSLMRLIHMTIPCVKVDLGIALYFRIIIHILAAMSVISQALRGQARILATSMVVTVIRQDNHEEVNENEAMYDCYGQHTRADIG